MFQGTDGITDFLECDVLHFIPIHIGHSRFIVGDRKIADFRFKYVVFHF